MGAKPTVEEMMRASEPPADPIERLDRPTSGIADMTAVILCGGQGTRLREETEFKPKPMVEVGGRPILWHIMKLYRHFGVRNFVLCLGYRGDMIRDYFLICESYYQAIRNSTPAQIEALDMGRRGLHNEASEVLQTRLKGKIDTDLDTARRLFTPICALHWRG